MKEYRRWSKSLKPNLVRGSWAFTVAFLFCVGNAERPLKEMLIRSCSHHHLDLCCIEALEAALMSEEVSTTCNMGTYRRPPQSLVQLH